MDIGSLRHRVILQNPGTPVPDGDGGYAVVQTAAQFSPVWASIVPATTKDLERLVAGAIEATATHVVTIRYQAGVTTKTRLTYDDRIFDVLSVQNVDERNVQLVLVCAERIV